MAPSSGSHHDRLRPPYQEARPGSRISSPKWSSSSKTIHQLLGPLQPCWNGLPSAMRSEEPAVARRTAGRMHSAPRTIYATISGGTSGTFRSVAVRTGRFGRSAASALLSCFPAPRLPPCYSCPVPPVTAATRGAPLPAASTTEAALNQATSASSTPRSHPRLLPAPPTAPPS